MTQIVVETGDARLDGDLDVPDGVRGVVVFAHGSGSSRFSPRNQAVAADLRAAGFATLLFDLLRPDEEEADRAGATIRFDVDLLAPRLAAAASVVHAHPDTAGLPVGLFGASTGAAVALRAAARGAAGIGAVVSRGGRPDLAGDDLRLVPVPVLLIVGERDPQVLSLNRQSAAALPRAEVRVVPGASHLFSEPGALETVSRHAVEFFGSHLAS